MNKNTCLLIIILLVSFYSHYLFANHDETGADSHSARPELIKIKDLRKTARLAQSKNLPILIMFGTDECPYCKLLKEDFLIPIIISGDYTDKIILREAHIGNTSIIDFSGKKISTSEFSARYGVTLFPTTIFIDSTGQVLTKKIIGITTPSLFGGTLDNSIDEALMFIRKKQFTIK